MAHGEKVWFDKLVCKFGSCIPLVRIYSEI